VWTDSSRPRSSRQLHTWPWLDEQSALRCGAAAGMAPVCHGGLRLYRGAATLSTPCGEPHKTRPAPRSLSVVVAREPQVTHEHVRKTPTSVLSYVPTIRQSVSHGFWSVVTEASRPRGPVSGITWLSDDVVVLLETIVWICTSASRALDTRGHREGRPQRYDLFRTGALPREPATIKA